MSLTVRCGGPAEDREVLVSWTRSPSLRAGLAQRARIVLLADEGVGTNEIVRRVGVSKPTVIAWKKRYAAEGIAGLEDRPKPGRPGSIDAVAVVLATLEPPPQRAGGDALVEPAAGRAAGHQRLQRVHDLAEVGPAAVAGGDVQVLHRPGAGGQGPRRRRAVPEPAGQGGGAVRRREVPDPGAGPDRADPADAARACRRSRPTTTSGTAPPPCSPRWRSPPARSPTPATRGTATRSSCASSSRSPRPTRG